MSAHYHAIPDYNISQSEFFRLEGIHYIDFMKEISAFASPQSYFEIGTETGRSCIQFNCPTICVDPQFKITQQIFADKTELHMYQMPSDVFFRGKHLDRIFPDGVDICFLDGMHHCEYLLRDFMNAERSCKNRSLVLMHDCLPTNQRMALRTHETGGEDESEATRYAWTGDVWRVVPILLKYRPDLKISLFDCPPSGLVAITNLDPQSRVIAENYHEIVKEMSQLAFAHSPFEAYEREVELISSRRLLEYPHNFSFAVNIW